MSRSTITPRTRRAAILVAAAVLTGGLAACGAAPQESAAPRSAPHHELPATAAQLVSMMRATTTYDYQPIASPTALRSFTDVSVEGTIAKVSSGLVEQGPEDTGAVVYAVRPSATWKNDAGRKDASVVYFVVHRPTNVDVAVYRKAMPVGTRVALFGSRSTLTLVQGAPGDVVYEPHPQGLFVDTGGGEAANVWGEDSKSLPGWRGVTSFAALERALA